VIDLLLNVVVAFVDLCDSFIAVCIGGFQDLVPNLPSLISQVLLELLCDYPIHLEVDFVLYESHNLIMYLIIVLCDLQNLS